MASSDDDLLSIALLGMVGYLLYQYFKQHGFNFQNPFSASGGAPGPLPFGAGGTPGGGAATGGSGGTGPGPATGTLPSPEGAGSGTIVCIDDNTGQVVGVPDAAGNCPAGSTLTLSVNVTS